MKGKTETWEELKVALWYKFDEEIKGGNTGAWMQAFYKALDTYSAVLLASQKEAVYQQGRASVIEELEKKKESVTYNDDSGIGWAVPMSEIIALHQSTREVV